MQPDIIVLDEPTSFLDPLSAEKIFEVIHDLNQTLGNWPRVKITPMFGRWGYFVGPRLFACFPLRDRDRDLWIRLAPADQARALREPGVRPHRRFAGRGWIELVIESDADVPRALGWLRRARAAAMRDDDPESG